MLENLLISLFGKRFFIWEGHQEIKKQRYMKQLDVLVGEDSVAELQTDVHNLEQMLDSGLYTKDQIKESMKKLDTKREMLTRTSAKLGEHHQMLANLDYKLDLFRRL